MPELPEVETIKRGLEKRIVGLNITKIQINSPKFFIGKPEIVEGKKVLNVWRRAKVLGIDLESSFWGAKRLQNQKTKDSGQARMTLLIHLKMSGQLIWEKGQRFIGGHPTQDMIGAMPNKHTRVEFSFSDPLRPLSEASGSSLYFNDQRRFGWIKVIKGDLGNMGYLGNLGPEPLEKGFTWEILKKNLLKHKKTPVKVAIMDQSVVSGVGNIYACEACFLAGIDPKRKIIDLDDEGFKKIHKAVISAIKKGIKYGGSSKTHFVDADGRKGFFLDYAFVYGRAGKDCKKCKSEIKKIKLGGRGTFFCPSCQT